MESARSESHSSAQAQQVASQRAKEIEASTSGLKQARENEVSLLTEKEGEVVTVEAGGGKSERSPGRAGRQKLATRFSTAIVSRSTPEGICDSVDGGKIGGGWASADGRGVGEARG